MANTVRVKYKYGSYDLVVIGDPPRLMDVPIHHYEGRLRANKSIGAKQSSCDKIFEPYADNKAIEDSKKNG